MFNLTIKEGLLFGVPVLTTIIIFMVIKIKAQKLENFLFSNSYYYKNKDGKIIYIKVSKKKDRIILKNSLFISIEKVEQDRDKWERFYKISIFKIEMNKQNLEIMFFGNENEK